MLKSIIAFLTAMFTFGSKKIDEQTFVLNKSNKENINLEILMAEFDAKTSEELKHYNAQINTAVQNLFLTENKLKTERLEFNTLLAKLKENKDDSRLRALTENKLKLVKVYEASVNRQGEAVNKFREKIKDAQTNRDITIANLQAAQVEYSLVSLESSLVDTTLDYSSKINLKEIQDIIDGKRAWVQAVEENDKVLNRKDDIITTTDSEISKELDELLK